MVGPWVGATIATAMRAGGPPLGAQLVGYTFSSNVADADAYLSEVGGKTLAVWGGEASVTGNKLQSTTTALMRARCNPGAATGLWRAEFVTPASVTNAEFYVDFRDNGTNRLSAAMEAAGNRIYLFDGYTASTLTQTGLTVLALTTYEIEVSLVGNAISVYLNGALTLTANTASGAGSNMGGVTTAGQIIPIDNLEAYS